MLFRSAQGGYATQIDFCGVYALTVGGNGNPNQHYKGSVLFMTSDGSTTPFSNGADSTPFYGSAVFVGNWFTYNTDIRIRQAASTVYSVYINAPTILGNGHYTVVSQGTWQHFNTAQSPTGCYITPTSLYQLGLNGNNYTNLLIDTVQIGRAHV